MQLLHETGIACIQPSSPGVYVHFPLVGMLLKLHTPKRYCCIDQSLLLKMSSKRSLCKSAAPPMRLFPNPSFSRCFTYSTSRDPAVQAQIKMLALGISAHTELVEINNKESKSAQCLERFPSRTYMCSLRFSNHVQNELPTVISQK